MHVEGSDAAAAASGGQMPFFDLAGNPDPTIDLRQVSPNAFQLLTAFQYVVPERGGKTYEVPKHDTTLPPTPGNRTDLASVPFWLWWFVASHGRHTRAALLHDRLVNETKVDRDEADRVFRFALEESDVRWMRRWLMWTAVSLATMMRRKPLRFATFVLMLVGLVALAAAWPLGWLDGLPFGLPAWSPALALGLLGLVHGRRWLLAVLGLALILAPTLLVFATLGVVWLGDLVAAADDRRRRRRSELPDLVLHRNEFASF